MKQKYFTIDTRIYKADNFCNADSHARANYGLIEKHLMSTYICFDDFLNLHTLQELNYFCVLFQSIFGAIHFVLFTLFLLRRMKKIREYV